VRAVRVDRTVAGELESALGDGVDLLVDVVAFTHADAEQLNALAGRVGSVVAISSASVYADESGRTLDEATSLDTFPRLPLPIPESQRTVEPSDATYSTQKRALELALLEGPVDVTVVRPCAIHGPGSELPRELYFVKRVLDGRRAVVLVSNGASRFHTTSVDNVAELIRLAAERPGSRVVNCGDPEPPSVLEIGRAVGAALGHAFDEVLIAESSYERRDLSNPWAVPFPLVVDMGAAERELGYRPVTSYVEAVRATCAWLAEEAPRRDWTGTYLGKYFDYAAEDAVRAKRG
jgi:nucleoside-diphosphate-sugar epimerase